MSAMVSVEALSPVLGAEVTGTNIAAGVSDEQFAEVEQAFAEHQILLFRNQEFEAKAHERFAKKFGPLEEVRTAPEDGARTKYVMYVANRPVDGKEGILPDGEMHFHTDQCYYQVPARITTLHALEIPKVGGNTLFLSAREAYDALTPDMKSRLAGLEAEHVYDYGGSPTLRPDSPNADAPRFVHPVVIQHPGTGRPSLYVNRLMTSRILGMAESESAQLLEVLFEHMEQPQFIYEHKWQPGDLVMWDNLCTMHARRDFDPNERRILRRVTVRGQQPEAA